ncbi:glycosyltransferase [Thalassolituus oleivorans]|uniref:GlgA3 gene product n=1 Tax=Thalassolituus oleivorans MIL-1 TaxID=1298593 RepID=M5DRY4_9GAMM|nr:glycosyltransferase [Thalassolituus oleivorans]APR66684.1 hypothetical protein CN03_06875 [Thalassolituus oleivorans]CCU72681.1 glgA3 gene product [Thalassolituus oleivorans MIL-1]
MKILQVSKSDSFGGGASKVASQLTDLMNNLNHQVEHLASWSGYGYNSTRKSLYGRNEQSIRRLHYYTKKIGFPEYIPYEYPSLLSKVKEFNPDVIHFHDLSSAISPLTLSLLAESFNVVWTLHDCSPFTGGCLYPLSCEKYKQKCGSCPQSGNWPIDSVVDTTSIGLRLKKYVHSKSNITLISPSNWMADMAYNSKMIKNRPFVIPNAVDEIIYNPARKHDVPDKGILDYDGLKVIISAGDLNDYRKGIAQAIEAVQLLEEYNPLIILVGSYSEEINSRLKGFNRVFTGYISEPVTLAAYFSAADIFLFSSLADNMPLSVLESLSCGTPIVGYKTGGVVDMVKHLKNGYLVDQGDIEGLVDGLKLAMNCDILESWSVESRLAVERSYTQGSLIQNHMNLYKEIMG